MKARAVAGWLAVVLATGLSCLWAFWGIIENFHEGWYSSGLATNLGLMFAQYLAPFLLFLLLTLIAIRWPYAGGALFVAAGLALRIFLFSGGSAFTWLILIPFTGLGLLFALGRINPRKWALRVAVVLPLATLVISGIQPAWMVIKRDQTVELQAQTVNGLLWAPAGPGWPEEGMSWQQAKDVCAHLSPDGTHIAFRRGWDLYSMDLASGKETRLTTNGSETMLPQVRPFFFKTASRLPRRRKRRIRLVV